jgi:glycosyltransferase involved in cell wall biosynthesis
MRILLIYNEYIYGGGEDTSFFTLAELLKNHGHEVYLYTKSSKSIQKNLISKLKVGVGMIFNSELLNDLSEVISHFEPDIVHLQNIYPLLNDSIYALFKERNLPVVQSIYNYRYVCPKMSLFRNGKVCTDCVRKIFPYPAVQHSCYNESAGASFAFGLSHSLYKFSGLYKNITTFLFPSRFIQQFYLDNVRIAKEQTKIIPNCYLPIKSKEIHKNKKDFILFYGRLTEEKGIPLLLNVAKKIPEIPIVIIGDGPLKDIVKNYSRKNKNIMYKGVLKRNEIFGYLNNAKFVVMPSAWFDALPNVLIESFAHKKPVIAPDFGVFTDLIKDKITGLHYTYNDESDLKDKIEFLYNNTELAEELGRNAYAEYKQEYTSEIYYSRIENLYKNLLKK